MSTLFLATPSSVREPAIPTAIRDRGRSAAVLCPQLRARETVGERCAVRTDPRSPTRPRSDRDTGSCAGRVSGCVPAAPAAADLLTRDEPAAERQRFGQTTQRWFPYSTQIGRA